MNWEFFVSIALTIVSLIGAFLNARGNIWGFFIWIPANLGWITYDILTGDYPQAGLFAAYTGITIMGIYQWRKHKIGIDRKQ